MRHTISCLAILSFLSVLPPVLTDANLDKSRLGEYYTAISIYRSGTGTNVVSVGFGTPPQDVNLTLTTNVEFIMVATTDCQNCVNDADEFIPAQSTSITPGSLDIVYNLIQPFGTSETLSLTSLTVSDILTDPRQDTISRPFTLVTAVQEDGNNVVLTSGTTGFFGLGINQDYARYSIIPSVLATDISGNTPPSVLIGFDMNDPTNQTVDSAGTMHWGGAPTTAYEGQLCVCISVTPFQLTSSAYRNWLNVNNTVAGSWGLPVDRIRVGGRVVDTSSLYGSLDPSYDGIWVPNAVAESLWSSVSGAVRDLVDATRWNIPCNINISMSVTIAGHEYQVSSSALVQARDTAGNTCWGNLIAWNNGTLPDTLGEVRLGTAFMSGIYSVLYYDGTQQLIGIAGKPGSANALNVNGAGGHVNKKLAGILIGSLLLGLILVFIMCYARNRSQFQSVWYRAIRRQHRLQTNAMVRAATMPPVPPMMPVPMPFPVRPPIPIIPGPPMYQPLPMFQPPMPMPPPPQYWHQQHQGAQSGQAFGRDMVTTGTPESVNRGPVGGAARRHSGERNSRSPPRQHQRRTDLQPRENTYQSPPRQRVDRHKSLPVPPQPVEQPNTRRASGPAYPGASSPTSVLRPHEHLPNLDARTHASLPRDYSGPEAEAWVSKYQGVGEGQQRYPAMPVFQTRQQRLSIPSSDSESLPRGKRLFWNRNANEKFNGQDEEGMEGKRRSWFGGSSSGRGQGERFKGIPRNR
ncbi:aspartic peptidase domain-containing protein [Naematelia encephala]|uniref:Aspartic peptidase domain-containing protein n=1 Tax=Naematelia encephala TaxID=71784 RepID=A0A1Y2B481_9TREE|nr:aspartic peptidase domain-containing protein [Naematelia encephala]